MIVVGGSLGGMRAARILLQSLPASFPEPIAMVLHRQKDTDDSLLEILRLRSNLPVDEALDKEPIHPGHVWLAPADYHLLVEDEHLSLSTDDPVNFARPSIDLLFESAADVYGSTLTGVILTGANQDGAQGAVAIKRRGGTVIVENPDTAECGVMPMAALEATRTPHVYAVEKIPLLLMKMSAAQNGKQA